MEVNQPNVSELRKVRSQLCYQSQQLQTALDKRYDQHILQIYKQKWQVKQKIIAEYDKQIQDINERIIKLRLLSE